ncbi:hypothetical protein CLV57_3022 [Mucilaginibacter auburnensis]|uniref:Uncharacterized protein n=1 Tax=Mucilaginibacter auburnensis TaxID=1457233 RepID=A0A2H9VNK3_9SPHI|nr:hypothetical protein CLV57_3022 [Mucilaginibacter auburnensis]
MSQTNNHAYLQKQRSFKLHAPSLLIFVFAIFIAWAINIAPHMIPGGFASNFWIRTSLIIIADALLLYVTFNLLKRNNILTAALGLVYQSTCIKLYLSALLSV